MPKQSYGITIKGAHFIHDAELVSAFEALDRAREASQKVSLASVRSVLVQALGQDSDKAQRILAQLTDSKVLSR